MMRLDTILVIVAAFVTAVVAAGEANAQYVTHITPEGAEVFRLVFQFTDVGMPGEFCSNVTFAKDEIFHDLRLWAYSGFQALAKKVYEHYKVQSKMTPRALRYQDVEAKANPEDVPPLELGTSCVSRRMILEKLSPSGAICSCISGLAADRRCSMVDAYSTTVYCYDKMAEALDTSHICPTLLLPSLGIEYSEMCTGSVAGVVTSLNMDLYDLSYNAPIPDVVDAKIAAQESRAYYLAHKAVEKLTRWADAHLLCKSQQEDLQVLPTWTSSVYYHAYNYNDGMYVPFAVVAHRSRDGPESGTPSESVLLVIRDARNSHEGYLAAANRLGRKLVRDAKGAVHAGYDVAAVPLRTTFALYLEQFFALRKNVTQPRVIVVGSGLFGSGVAAIVSHDIAHRFPRIPETKTRISHHLITFEGGAVGDFDFNENLRRVVNVRNLVAQSSGWADMPCASPTGCGKEYVVRTGETGEPLGPFIPLPGRVEVPTSDLGPVWDVKTNNLEIVANFACATSCWLASNLCSDDPLPPCSVNACGGFFTEEALSTSTA